MLGWLILSPFITMLLLFVVTIGLLNGAQATFVSSDDGLRFDFGLNGEPTISKLSVDGESLGPTPSATPSAFGFQVSDFLHPQGVSSIELLQNGNFTQAGTAPSNAAQWSPYLSGYTRVTNVSRSAGGVSLMLVGGAHTSQGTGAGAVQHVTFNASVASSDRLLLGGWAKTDAVTGAENVDFGLYCDIEYLDGTHLYGQSVPFATNTHDWQLFQHVIDVAKPLKQAAMYILLRNNHSGAAFVTDVSLVPMSRTTLADGTIKAETNGSVTVVATSAPSAVEVKANFEGLSNCIRVTGSITNTNASLTDRAVSLTFALPLNASGWHFTSDLDSDTVLGVWDSAIGLQYQSQDLPFATDYYPFLTLHSDSVGLAAGVTVDGPVFVSRTIYSGLRTELSVTADFALTNKSRRFQNTATFEFVFFRVEPPTWGFRAALDRYYSLFPSFSENVISDQGNWLVSVGDVDSIENHSDFGFRFDEGGGSPSECKIFNKNNIGVFPYIEPHLVHWELPRNTTIDYAHIVASMQACLANATQCLQHNKAEYILLAGVVDANGDYRWRPEDEAWNFGCVMWVDLDPDGRVDAKGPVAHELAIVTSAYAAAQTNNYTINGIYVDSVANAQNLLNYRSSTLANTHYPPVFDGVGRPVVLMLQNTQAFLDYLRISVLAPKKGVLMGNGPFYPETQYRLAPVFAVTGGETFWYKGEGSTFTPTPRELMALHRVMAYQRPYLPLQDSNFFDWTYDMTDQYHQVELTLGMWPGYFSGDASGNPYFQNATWYNRDRPVFQRYVPVLHVINEAGWQPITAAAVATATPPAANQVWVERFGPSAGFVYYTIRNEGRPDLVESLTFVVDTTLLPITSGSHNVWEITHNRHIVVDGGASQNMKIIMNTTSVGAVEINTTLVLKIELAAM